VDSLLFVLVNLRSYFNVGKTECNSFLNYSCECKSKGGEAEGKLGKDGMITNLEQVCLPTAVGLTERGGEKAGKGSRAGEGGENEEEKKIFNCEDLY
jgi:hypothetical protein